MAPESPLSPGLLKKVVHAGAHSISFRQAAEDLKSLAEVTVSAQRVRRATETIGRERVALSEAQAAAFDALPLPARLPITSSHVESTIKRINRRMKGSEKFWDQGAEPLLHLAADYLSPANVLDHFWSQRPTNSTPNATAS